MFLSFCSFHVIHHHAKNNSYSDPWTWHNNLMLCSRWHVFCFLKWKLSSRKNKSMYFMKKCVSVYNTESHVSCDLLLLGWSFYFIIILFKNFKLVFVLPNVSCCLGWNKCVHCSFLLLKNVMPFILEKEVALLEYPFSRNYSRFIENISYWLVNFSPVVLPGSFWMNWWLGQQV